MNSSLPFPLTEAELPANLSPEDRARALEFWNSLNAAAASPDPQAYIKLVTECAKDATTPFVVHAFSLRWGAKHALNVMTSHGVAKMRQGARDVPMLVSRVRVEGDGQRVVDLVVNPTTLEASTMHKEGYSESFGELLDKTARELLSIKDDCKPTRAQGYIGVLLWRPDGTQRSDSEMRLTPQIITDAVRENDNNNKKKKKKDALELNESKGAIRGAPQRANLTLVSELNEENSLACGPRVLSSEMLPCPRAGHVRATFYLDDIINVADLPPYQATSMGKHVLTLEPTRDMGERAPVMYFRATRAATMSMELALSQASVAQPSIPWDDSGHPMELWLADDGGCCASIKFVKRANSVVVTLPLPRRVASDA